MRRSLPLLIIGGLGIVYLWQKQNEGAITEHKPSAVGGQTVATQSQATQQLTPAPRGQASEQNWMKRSLDRAATVRDLARKQTSDSQDPH